MSCPFCALEPSRIVVETDAVIVLRDAFPVSAGHLLIVPRRHCPRWGDATAAERAALLAAIDAAQAQAVAADPTIAGWNVGWNDGAVAGQTVMHLHVHLIPRRAGDVPDPRGGIRWVLPAHARYWP